MHFIQLTNKTLGDNLTIFVFTYSKLTIRQLTRKYMHLYLLSEKRSEPRIRREVYRILNVFSV